MADLFSVLLCGAAPFLRADIISGRVSRAEGDGSALRRDFGNRLKAIRRGRELTQEQFAELVGISVDFLAVLAKAPLEQRRTSGGAGRVFLLDAAGERQENDLGASSACSHRDTCLFSACSKSSPAICSGSFCLIRAC